MTQAFTHPKETSVYQEMYWPWQDYYPTVEEFRDTCEMVGKRASAVPVAAHGTLNPLKHKHLINK